VIHPQPSVGPHVRCPLCGEPAPDSARRSFARAVECAACGERLELAANPAIPEAEIKRPFWSDQFRSQAPVDDPFDASPLAEMDPLMLVVASGFAILIVAALFIATAGSMLE
jgi:hypothetical protein